MTQKHNHKEAFCLMTYACVGSHVPAVPGSRNFMDRTAGCGHRERFWNSRDGVTPFMMGCPSCGGDLQHVDWHDDVYAPNHVPHWGQGIWRDGTPDEAEAIMRRRVDAYPARDGEEAARIEAAIKAAREPSEHGEFQKGWPMFARSEGKS